MNIVVEPGVYVLAVSGGIDSMALLHALSELPDVTLIVAHLNHGIRTDSDEDRQLVEQTASEYGLRFEYAEARLGVNASEATARAARYDFLRTVKAKHKAIAIITAHHQGDVVETALLNLLRGPSRKGFAGLTEHSDMVRPLLQCSKSEILMYAQRHQVTWREDSTNMDIKYLRNYVRLHVVPRMTDMQRNELLMNIKHITSLNYQIDKTVNELFINTSDQLSRQWFILLPHAVACEVMAAWLRNNKQTEFSSTLINQLVIAAKVGSAASSYDVSNRLKMVVTVKYLALKGLER